MAARSLARAPGFTLAAVATLALGLGAATALFTVVNAVLLHPLPLPQPRQLVEIGEFAPGAPSPMGANSGSGELGLSASLAQIYSERNRSFSALGIWSVFSDVISGGNRPPERARTFAVTSGVLRALAVPPLAGRWFTPADEQPHAQPAAVLGYGFWRRRFGGDRAVVGQMLMVNGAPRLVVGIMPRGFSIPGGLEPELILPLQLDRAALTLGDFEFSGVARLRPGVSRAAAANDLQRLLPVWLRSYPGTPEADAQALARWRIAPFVRPLSEVVIGAVRGKLWAAMGASALLLLLACANVLNLFFVRAEARRQDFAIRVALGASSARAARGLALEGVLVALTAGTLGLALARAGVLLLQHLAPAGLPRIGEIRVGAPALAFAAAAALLAGPAIAALPALRVARSHVGAQRAATASRESRRSRAGLVIVQVALALVLVLGAGLLVRSLAALRSVAPGFSDPASLQTFRLTIPASVAASSEGLSRMQQTLVERIAAIPAVTAAAFASGMPMQGYGGDWRQAFPQYRPDLAGSSAPVRFFVTVSPGFFHAAGTDLIAGREFTWADLEQRRPYAIVSAALARQWWGSPRAALGRQLRAADDPDWRQVIGVVAGMHFNGVDRPAPATIFEPPADMHSATFIVRSRGAGTAALLGQLRQAVAAADRSLPLYSSATMEAIYSGSISLPSFLMRMMALTGGLAFVLGVVGVYAVVACAVAQRRREIAIRMALGASATEVRRLFVRGALRLGLAGVGLGLIAASVLARALASLLFGVSPFDLGTYALAALALLGAVAAAGYLPARRASAVAPAEALKSE